MKKTPRNFLTFQEKKTIVLKISCTKIPNRKVFKVATSDRSDSDDNDEYRIVPNPDNCGSSNSEDCLHHKERTKLQ